MTKFARPSLPPSKQGHTERTAADHSVHPTSGGGASFIPAGAAMSALLAKIKPRV